MLHGTGSVKPVPIRLMVPFRSLRLLAQLLNVLDNLLRIMRSFKELAQAFIRRPDQFCLRIPVEEIGKPGGIRQDTVRGIAQQSSGSEWIRLRGEGLVGFRDLAQ
jgi:hypothetical protein